MAVGIQRRNGRPPAGGRLTGGGTDGNEQLTAAVGAALVVILAVLGVTLLRMHQLIWVHLFVGLALIGPVAVKLGSTGYRFVRYYTHDPAYRRKGPPELVLRVLGPGLILTTLAVLASGIVLMLDGPARQGRWLEIHKVSFIVWGVLLAAHVLGHLRQMPRALRAAATHSGAAGRTLALAGGLLAGLLIAAVLIPDFASWTSVTAFRHH
ncbi:MAG TPA: hypothetical protein VIJ51_10210 [Solirubrobacteraceae bacterium]